MSPALRSLAIVATAAGANVAWATPPAVEATPSEAQETENTSEPAFAWTVPPVTLDRAHRGSVEVGLTVPEGFRVFQGDIVLEVVDGGPLTLADPVWPEGRVVHDGEDAFHVYDAGQVHIALPVDGGAAEPGLHVVRLHAEVRGCAAKRCHQGTQAELEVLVHIQERGRRRTP